MGCRCIATDPPCVYAGFWHDVAPHEFLAPDRPTVSKEKWGDIPWYWEPTTPVPKKSLKPFTSERSGILDDRDWQRIGIIYTPYTTSRTGDPDFPIVIDLDKDRPGAAYYVRWDQGKIRLRSAILSRERDHSTAYKPMVLRCSHRTWVSCV